MAPKVIGIVTCNYSSKDAESFTADRPIAATPFAGRYRVVDFAMSNLVNYGIRTVGMIMPHNYRSLIDHVGAGKDWDLDRKNGGLFVMPGSAFGTARRGSRFLLRDLIENKAVLTRNTHGYVVLTSANFVYNYDLGKLVDEHLANGADITVLTQTAPAANDDVVAFEVKDGEVKGMKLGVEAGETAFIDCFIIKRSLLLDMLDWYAAEDHLDLFEAIFANTNPVCIKTLDFDGYCAPVFDKAAFYGASMDLRNPAIAAQLFLPDRFIKTKSHDTSPAKFEVGSRVVGSLVSSGSRIYGEVEGSVLSRNVIVEAGAKVTNSIIMQGTVIKSGAVIDYAIVDRNNVIPAGTVLKGTAEDVLVKGKARG